MITFKEFCTRNKLGTNLKASYIEYGFYCQGYADALSTLTKVTKEDTDE